MNPKPNNPLLEGLKTSLAPAGLVLIITFFAFGALIKATNLPLGFGLALTLFIFAIPGQIILVDEITRNAAPFAIFISVMLTAIRLLPLTVSLMPVLKTEKTSKTTQFFIAHFVAVTVWVQSMMSLPTLPKEQRAAHCIGLCIGLLSLTLMATIAGFYLAEMLPAPLVAATLMVTPIYFFLSLIETSKTKCDKLAFLFGALIAIPLSLYTPDLALMGAGLIGGTLAFLLQKNKGAK